jgi:hypothetical protein
VVVDPEAPVAAAQLEVVPQQRLDVLENGCRGGGVQPVAAVVDADPCDLEARCHPARVVAPFEQDDGQTAAGCVAGGGEAGGATAQDYEVGVHLAGHEGHAATVPRACSVPVTGIRRSAAGKVAGSHDHRSGWWRDRMITS